MTLDEMEAEIIRLRAVCEAHDVDPDWVPPEPEPEQFGPPTEFEWRMHRLMVSSTRHMADLLVRTITDRTFLEGDQWPNVGELRIKVPDSLNPGETRWPKPPLPRPSTSS